MTGRRKLIGGVLAAILTAGGVVGAASAISVEPRIVDATVDRVSLDHVDFSVRIALRASEPTTIRQITFTEAYLGSVPVWIAPLEGPWVLRPAEELILPEAMQVRVLARDALGAADLSAMVGSGAIPVRASVEVAVETPWLGRLLFMGPTQVVVREVTLSMPVPAAPSALQPLARLSAMLGDAAQRNGVPWLTSGMNRTPERRAVLERFGGSVAAVTTRYVIEQAGTSAVRERRAAGYWWSTGVFCTTREAVEPWRFDPVDATSLQHGGGRLRRDQGAMRIDGVERHPALSIDLARLDGVLPEPDERRVYTYVGDDLRRLRLADRLAASNLLCLRLGEGAAAMLPGDGPGAAAADDVAAVVPGTPPTVAWTKARPGGAADRLTLETPLVRATFGAPLVTSTALIGLVGSSTTAFPASAVASAAARAARVPAAPDVAPAR